MAIKLVCTSQFHGYTVGQEITDPHLVEELLKDRDHHFVKVTIDDPPPADPEPRGVPTPISSVEPDPSPTDR